MRRGVLLDTGPLVASLNRRDRYHEWAREELADIEPPLLTCEAVLAESCHLLRRIGGGAGTVIELLRRRVIDVPFRASEHARRLDRLMRKYEDVPISFADACLVRMTELYDFEGLMTLDSDFRIYRRHGRRTIPVLTPR